MDKKVLKAVSMGITIGGLIISGIGSLVNNKIQSIEIQESVNKVAEKLNVQ